MEANKRRDETTMTFLVPRFEVDLRVNLLDFHSTERIKKISRETSCPYFSSRLSEAYIMRAPRMDSKITL